MTSAELKPATGAERYFARQQQDSDFSTAYVQARAEIDFIDDVIRQVDQRRRELGLSAKEMAQQAGVSERRLRHLLTARRRRIRLGTVAAVSAAVGIELHVGVDTGRAVATAS